MRNATSSGPTIGVLSLVLGGEYCGGVVSGIQRVVAEHRGRVVGVRTLQLWQDPVLGFEPNRYVPYSWDSIEGFILILDAVRREDLLGIQDTGKPIVSVSTHYPDLGIPAVLPDNRSGIIELVQHLTGHGHTRIAFMGCLANHDGHERYLAYQDALRAAGLQPDPALLFEAPNNLDVGGIIAAGAMLAAGMPCTAVCVATDDNALALMTKVQEAGYRVPADLAIVSYDDSPTNALYTPALTTVQMKPEDVGAVAAETLLARLTGDSNPTPTVLVPARVIYRQSCGCWSGLIETPDPPDPATSRDDSMNALIRAMTVDVSGAAEGPAEESPAVNDAVARIVTASIGVVRGEPLPTPGALAPAWRHIVAGAATIEQVSRAFGRMLDYIRDQCESSPAKRAETRAAIEVLLNEMRVELIYAVRYPSVARGFESEATKHQSYNASKTLLEQNDGSPRDLSWLRVTAAQAACLGLWRDDVAGGELIISSVYTRSPQLDFTPAAAYRPEEFPPLELFEPARQADDRQSVIVIPLQTATRDWGVLAIMTPLETQGTAAADTVWQWAVLLIAALERERLLESLRQSEKQLVLLAHHDVLTGLPNRALFYDRMEQLLSLGRRYRTPFAMMLLDFNKFKSVNDTLGHAAGDHLLQLVAQRARAVLRDSDTVARLGGDEFAILVHGTSNAGAEDVADRIRAALMDPIQLEQGTIQITVSIGIAIFPTNGETYGALFEYADHAMYNEKHAS